MPRLLRRELPEFEIRTVQEEGWSGLNSGALLREAQSTFDVLVTVDKRLSTSAEHCLFTSCYRDRLHPEHPTRTHARRNPTA
jgi:hypothetical protein